MYKFKTYREEQVEKQRANIERLRARGPFWTYRPGLLDLFRPNVIRGVAIAEGARVFLVRDQVDPLGKIVWIQDMAGNQQSVWRKALVAEVRS